jgi:ribosomal protein S18 acetylase RimI-like enzyme
MGAEEELLHLSDLNVAEAHREHARFLANHHVEERDGLLLCASGTRSPASPFNAVLRVGPDPADPAQLLDEARAFFGRRDRGFSVFVRAHLDADLIGACERAGFPCLSGRAPGMVLTEPPALAKDGSAITSRVVADAESARAFAEVCALAYEPVGLSPAVARKVFSQEARWLTPVWHTRVVYDGEQAVSAAMLLFSNGIAGIYWVGTIPAARGRGHAERVVREVSRYAFERGARAVVLQASKMGEPVYLRIGFREITQYPWYLVLAKSRTS